MSNVYEIYSVWQHRYSPCVKRNTKPLFGLQLPRFVQV
jgi:dATP pyrophosphohydrolase